MRVQEEASFRTAKDLPEAGNAGAAGRIRETQATTNREKGQNMDEERKSGLDEAKQETTVDGTQKPAETKKEKSGLSDCLGIVFAIIGIPIAAIVVLALPVGLFLGHCWLIAWIVARFFL